MSERGLDPDGRIGSSVGQQLVQMDLDPVLFLRWHQTSPSVSARSLAPRRMFLPDSMTNFKG
jgi:hypothetical protein